ncbi:hypothetical protein VTK73DRAFT_9282 [Phialemonium thermophilum]|uniref:DUF7728 domain-containing protein n=1 Tax=Phialemonium thermophilum TaxID=223376 RepID=A0ABR3W3B9_9PEZI
MLFKQFTVAASLVAASHAILIPPEISSVAKTPTVEVFVDSQQLNVSCSRCSALLPGHAGQSHLELSFTIDHGPEHDRLLVNSFALYPTRDVGFSVLSAPVVADDGAAEVKPKSHHHKHRKATPALPLGFGLKTNPVASFAGGQVVSLDFKIVQVGAEFDVGVPTVRINLLKLPQGALAISNIQVLEDQDAEGDVADGQEKCDTWLCEWIKDMKAKMSHFKFRKPCAGKMGGWGAARPEHAHPRPHPHHHHPHHPHHGEMSGPMEHGHHSAGMLAKSIAIHILLPVAIGIVAGVAVSFIGMIVATIIVAFWRMVFRRSSRRHAKRSQRKTTVGEPAQTEEKSGLLDDQDPPPSYEEAEVKKPEV